MALKERLFYYIINYPYIYGTPVMKLFSTVVTMWYLFVSNILIRADAYPTYKTNTKITYP